jgi:hypothetical protein
MKRIGSILLIVMLAGISFYHVNAQTKCMWIIKTQDGEQLQTIGISCSLVSFLGNAGGEFNLNGVKVEYKTLFRAYKNGSVLKIKDENGNGEIKIYKGTFDQKMNERSENKNRLIIENSKQGEEPEISKVRVKSIQATFMLLAMIGSKDIDEDMDNFESVLEPGGVLYVHNEKEDSTLWMYVN